MKLFSKRAHFALFFLGMSVILFLCSEWMLVTTRATLGDPVARRLMDKTVNLFLTMHGLLVVGFVVAPAIIGGFGHLLFKGFSRAFSLAAVGFMVLAIICLAVGLFWDFQSTPINEFGGGWVMYPPLSVEPTLSADFYWVWASFWLIGLSCCFNIASFFTPWIRKIRA